MRYVTINDLNNAIRTNLHRIPHNIDFVIGVPRSGMLPATIISELLNCPLIDLTSFTNGAKPTGGMRLGFSRGTGLEKMKVLVCDDTTFNGTSLRQAKSLLKGLSHIYDFTYMVIYKEGRSNEADIFLEDVSKDAAPIVIYEWNIFHHYPNIMEKCVYDIDGVFLLDPPDERDEEAYLNYIATAPPLFIPSNEIGAICSFRLEKNRSITEKWLADNGVKYRELIMYPSSSYEGRIGASPALFKAQYYKSKPWAELFIESDDDQAKEIARLSGKQVYCVSSNKVYKI